MSAAGQVARELLVRLGEGVTAAGDAGPHGVGGEAGLVGHLCAGHGERHGVAPARIEVGRHLQGGRRRLPAHAPDPHPVGPVLCELDGVEAGHRVGAQVARAPDLVEQLRGDRPDRHRAACPGMLGDHRRAVGVHLGDGKADPLAIGHLLEEGVVAAAALGAALDDVAGHHRARDGVEVGVGPPEGVQGRPDDQRGVGDPARHHHLRPGGQRVGDRAGAQVRVGRDDAGLGGEWLARCRG